MDRQPEPLERGLDLASVRAAPECDGRDAACHYEPTQAFKQAIDRFDAGNDKAAGRVEQRKSRLPAAGIHAEDGLISLHGCWVNTITIGMPPTCG